MSKKPDQYMQRAIKALVTLRQKVEAVSKTVWKINSLAEIPDEEKRKVFEKRLWDIFARGEYYAAKVLSDWQAAPIRSSAHLVRLLDWHKKEYKPVAEKIRELIPDLAIYAPTREDVEEAVVDFVFTDINESGELVDTGSGVETRNDIDNHMDEYEMHVLRVLELQLLYKNKAFDELRAKEGQSRADVAGQSPYKYQNIETEEKQDVKANFEHIGEAANYYLQDLDGEVRQVWIYEHGVDIALYYKIIGKNYFNPNEWVANEKDLSPIIVSHDLEDISRDIRLRVEEIYQSFIFGNWMAVIALSRSLLEYSIVDQHDLLQIKEKDLYIKDSHGEKKRKRQQLRSLGELIADVKGQHAGLREDMRQINKSANKVLHTPPPSNNPFENVRGFPSKQPAAKECIDAIVKIVSALYRA